MPTTARRAERTREARTTVIFVVTLTLLMLAGFARLYTENQQVQKTTHELAAQQQAIAAQVYQTCVSRNESRAETNTRILIPLRASLTVLADDVFAAAKKLTGARKVTSLNFAHRYLAYAAAVKPYAPVRCSAAT